MMSLGKVTSPSLIGPPSFPAITNGTGLPEEGRSSRSAIFSEGRVLGCWVGWLPESLDGLLGGLDFALASFDDFFVDLDFAFF